MTGTLLGLLLGLPAIGEAADWPVVTAREFRESFEAAQVRGWRLPDSVRSRARGFRFVLVGGLHGEGLPGYFAQNVQELRRSGVPSDAIHVVYPSSRRTMEENAGEMRERLHEIGEQGPEPLVIIGHSRGACDVLAFALGSPGFVATRVKAMFLVQGPFGGTGLADYVAGDGPPIDRRMPLVPRAMALAISQAVDRLADEDRHEAITALARRPAQDGWERLLKKNAAAVPVVSPRTFYITSRMRPSRNGLFQKATGTYLAVHYGENDGLIALRDQSLPGVGSVVAVLDAGHTDLTNRFPAGRARRSLRRGLIDAVLVAVAGAEPERH